MRILIINPNSTASMTHAIGRAGERAARAGTRITAINPTDTPPAIQGAADGEAALPGLLRLFDETMSDASHDACIIACFDDTGLMELKARASVPVIGIGEAAYMAALLMGARFSVVTTLPVSVPVLRGNIERYGFAERCASVRASDIPVLALDDDPAASATRIASQIDVCIREDGAQAIALGCAGMADLAADLTQRCGVPAIDGVAAAVAFAEALHQIGMAQGRRDAA